MKTLRVLLVEDNPDDALLVVREVTKGGYSVEHHRVETEPEMLAALQAQSWDLIISDFSLPTFNAPSAVRVLKESELDIPILIVSGTVGEETAIAALKAGAHDFLSKGSLNRLLPAIERELREASSRRERRMEQARLRQSEEALAAVFSASPLPIITLDVGGIVNGWNIAAERVFGWLAADAIGKHSSFIVAETRADWCDAVLGGETISNMTIEGVRRHGGNMQMLLFASPLHDTFGYVTGAVAIISDTTEHRALEDQLRQAQKMEAIGRLAGGIAHDFNNILTAIQGYATLLQDEFPEDSEHRGDVDGILDAASRASAFTRQLLAFSRKQVTQPEVLEPNELVSGMLNILSRVIGAEYELRFEPGTNVEPIFADRGQIGQVLMNLVVNARDSMEHGGIITLRTQRQDEKPEHRVRADDRELPGPYTVFQVSDQGHGIPGETLKRIFEPFFTTKDASKGTGLGLSTVYGIITQHGGFLRVDTSGSGTTFSVYLPERRGPDVARPTAEPAAPRRTVSAATILLVEDDQGIRNVLLRALKRAGFNVYAAMDGETALELLREHPEVDILVTDLMLPTMSGVDLIERAENTSGRIRSVLMSGYSAEDFALSPDVEFVEKPFSPDELVRAVRQKLAE